MIKYMVDELNDPEVTCDRFLRHANDYFNQRATVEGVERIFTLFDNDKTGVISKDDMSKLSSEFGLFLTID